MLPTQLKGLTTREAIADAIYRAVAACDENDMSLLDSATVPDGTLEADGQVLSLETAKNTIFARVGPMDTTHFITNVRIEVESEGATTASLTCNALAQHYPTGTGPTEAERRLLAASKYACDMVKDEKDGLWKVKKWGFRVVWREGDRSVMMPEGSG